MTAPLINCLQRKRNTAADKTQSRRRMIIPIIYYFNRFQEQIWVNLHHITKSFFKNYLRQRDWKFRSAAASALTVSRRTDLNNIKMERYKVYKIYFIYSGTQIAHGLGNV